MIPLPRPDVESLCSSHDATIFNAAIVSSSMAAKYAASCSTSASTLRARLP